MFSNAYKDNFAVFALIVSNLFPQNKISFNPIICDIFFHFNIPTTAKFTGISVHYFQGHVSHRCFHFNFSVFHESQLFLVEFYYSVNKSTDGLSHTLLYFQYLQATAKYQLFLCEDENNNNTVHTPLPVYSYTFSPISELVITFLSMFLKQNRPSFRRYKI